MIEGAKASAAAELAPCDVGDAAFVRRLASANINPDSYLATDYLNVFNEVVMLLNLVPDLPECFEDLRDWDAVSYEEHFRRSCCRDKDLAITAYQQAPERFRQAFDQIVAQSNRLILESLGGLEAAISAGDWTALRLQTGEVSQKLQSLIDMASAVIHGREVALDQEEVDRMMET